MNLTQNYVTDIPWLGFLCHGRLWNLQLHVYTTPFLCQLIVLCIYLVFDQTIWNSDVTYCCKIHELVWRVGWDSSGKSELLLVPTRGSQRLMIALLLSLCILVSCVKNRYISEAHEHLQPCSITISIPCLMINLL